jgi:hypothetical protein
MGGLHLLVLVPQAAFVLLPTAPALNLKFPSVPLVNQTNPKNKQKPEKDKTVVVLVVLYNLKDKCKSNYSSSSYFFSSLLS